MQKWYDFFNKWSFTLMTVLVMLVYGEMKEMKNDIKTLLAQSNVDKTEIQNLKDWRASFQDKKPLSGSLPMPEPLFVKIVFTNDTWLKQLTKRISYV